MKVQTRNIIIKKKSFVKSKVFKSSPDVSLMKSAKSTVTNKTSIFDTGASRSGTSDSSILKNICKCENVSVQGAFGPPFKPSLKGPLDNYTWNERNIAISIPNALQYLLLKDAEYFERTA